jgi:hypothetical protein
LKEYEVKWWAQKGREGKKEQRCWVGLECLLLGFRYEMGLIQWSK